MTENKNHVVNLVGRGASYCLMMTGDTQDVANRCQVCLDSGFEVYIYTLEPSAIGQLGFMPKGALNLRRVYHLYNAHDQYAEKASDIIDTLSCHSMQASIEYIDIIMAKLQAEKVNLEHDTRGFTQEVTPPQPTMPDSSTTGS